MNPGAQLTLSVWDPSLWDGDTHIQGGSFFGDADDFLLNLPPKQDLSWRMATLSASARTIGSSSRAGSSW